MLMRKVDPLWLAGRARWVQNIGGQSSGLSIGKVENVLPPQFFKKRAG